MKKNKTAQWPNTSNSPNRQAGSGSACALTPLNRKGVLVLVNYIFFLKVHLLLPELVRDLTQVKCGAGKAIQAGDNEAIPFYRCNKSIR
jgi:hypothetical protein